MAAAMLETPSRVWRRIQDVEAQDVPSLPSVPGLEDSISHPSETTTDDEDFDLPHSPHPIHSTPAAFSHHTASTIKAPLSSVSTARFAQSIASRSSKSSLSVSRGSVGRKGQQPIQPPPPDPSFDITSIPALPSMRRDDDDDMDIRSSDQDLEESTRSSVHEQYLPPDDIDGDDDDGELDITEALQSVELSRDGPPGGIQPTPKKKYDYSVSLRSEPKPSPFDKYRNVSFRRPLSRTRTPSLTRETPSPASSTGHSTPHSSRSINYSQAETTSPTPAEIPLPRSATVSPAVAPSFSSRQFQPTPPTARPTLYSRAQSASPFPALSVPLPRSNSASPAVGISPQARREQEYERSEVTCGQFSAPQLSRSRSQSERDMSAETDDNAQTEVTEQMTDQESQSHQTQESDQREPTFSSEEGGGFKYTLGDSTSTNNGGGDATQVPFSSPGVSALLTPTPMYQPRPRARFNVAVAVPSQESTSPPQSEHEQTEEGSQTGDEEVTYRPGDYLNAGQTTFDPRDDLMTPQVSHKRDFLMSLINSSARPRMKFNTPHPLRAGSEVLQTPGPSSFIPATPATVGLGAGGFHTTFAGITPRPRGPLVRPANRRASGTHPLSHAFTPGQPTTTVTAPSTTATESSAASTTSSSPHPTPHALQTYLPNPSSPYVESNQLSYISTTSSQDLTTHARANASFDPGLIGQGERGGGVGIGRFNAPKLNNYLHGLNRKLQEENEGLVEKLRAYEEVYGVMGESPRSVPGRMTGDMLRVGPDSPMQGFERFDEKQEQPQQQQQQSKQRRRSGGRRVSAGPAGLVDVVEDDVGEVWGEEKATLEAIIDDLKEELQSCLSQKQAAEEALDVERNGRTRDKELWKERMGEVETGVEGIVRELEGKQQEAEERAENAEKEMNKVVKEVERRLAEVVVERDVLVERLEKVETALETKDDLGKEINQANERVASVMSELKNANLQIRELEGEVGRAEGKVDALEAEIQEDQRMIKMLEDKVRSKDRELGEVVPKMERLERENKDAQTELTNTRSYVSELETQASASSERIDELESELGSYGEKLESLEAELEQERERISHLEEESVKAAEVVKQMEDALESAESQMQTDEQELAVLRSKVSSLERELDRSHSKLESSLHSRGVTISSTHTDSESLAQQAEIEALEDELAQAHKEIARLTTVMNQSPARKAIDKAKDSKIEMLERERDDLVERLKMMRSTSMAYHTPSKGGNGSGISPMHRQVLGLSFKSPKTPGGPLRDLSWLQSTFQTPGAAPLVAEIERLQHELDKANESIDEKLDRLEDAGTGTIKLTRQLEDARGTIISLEEEIGRIVRREDRRTKRLERMRCSKCKMKVDLKGVLHSHFGDESSIFEPSELTLPTEPPTPPTRSTEKLKLDLSAVNAQLISLKHQWEEERQILLGENAILQDATKRLNSEVKSAKDEVKKYAEGDKRFQGMVRTELEQAKSTVEDLESELKEERTRLRLLTTEQTRAEKQKEKLNLQLDRAESDMADIREQLQRIRQENHTLEKELRDNANAEQKARLLESKVAENAATMNQLRQERSILVSDHKSLQKRYSEASNLVSKLRADHAASQTLHETRRHQLDTHLLEISTLRKALSSAHSETASLQTQLTTLQTLHTQQQSTHLRSLKENEEVTRMVEEMEGDLRRVRKDAEDLGRDLRVVRGLKERGEDERKEERVREERRMKQRESEIRRLREELSEFKERVRESENAMRGHACVADQNQLAELKLKHNKECKGLFIRIRYLNAKFARETTFREDLKYQKNYLLALLAQSERGEHRILAAIARIGFPIPTPSPYTPPKSRLKSAVFSLIFIQRITRARAAWQEHLETKKEVNAALEDVRAHRAKVAAAATKTNANANRGSGATVTAAAAEVPVRRSEKAKGKQRER